MITMDEIDAGIILLWRSWLVDNAGREGTDWYWYNSQWGMTISFTKPENKLAFQLTFSESLI